MANIVVEVVGGAFALVWMQFVEARRELSRVFPSTFGRLVRVKDIKTVPTSESERRNLPGSWQAVHIHVAPDQYSWRGNTTQVWIDVDQQKVAAYDRSLFAKTHHHVDKFEIFGLFGGLCVFPITSLADRYYATQEARTGLFRNSHAMLRALRGQLPAEMLSALEAELRRERARVLAEDAKLRADFEARLAADKQAST